MEYDDVLQEMRTIMVLNSWIEEQKEDSILESLGAEPGDLHQLMAYATALGCGLAALVYAGRRTRRWEYPLTTTPVRLALQTLRVGGDRRRCRAAVRGLATFLASGCVRGR